MHMDDYNKGFNGDYVQDSFGNQAYNNGVHDRKMRDDLHRSREDFAAALADCGGTSAGYGGNGSIGGDRRIRIHIRIPSLRRMIVGVVLLFLSFVLYTFTTNYFAGQSIGNAAIANGKTKTSVINNENNNSNKAVIYNGNKAVFFGVNGKLITAVSPK